MFIKRSATAVLACFLLWGCCAAEAAGTLKLKVAIVTDTLDVKAVPAARFSIVEPGEETVTSLSTGLDGSALLELPPGTYSLKSAAPVVYLTKNYSWDKNFQVTDGEVTSLELTNNDAMVKDAEVSALPARQFDEAALLYKQLKDGVLTVESDSGHGTGFIVAPNLILTNSHVVEGSLFPRVRFVRGRKVSATIVCSDPKLDVAFLAADLSAFAEARPLKLATRPEGESLVLEGERVIAIGSPLEQDKVVTSGIVSKVEAGAIISDVNINPGNSGGPLLDLAGEVVGITTFGDFARVGPGVSGIVPITAAMPLMKEALEKIPSIKLPSSAMLPDVPDRPFPIDALEQAAMKELAVYEIKAPKNFQTLIYTPPVRESVFAVSERRLAKIKKLRDDKRGSQGIRGSYRLEQHKVWEQYVGMNDAVVTVIVQAVLRETSGSQWLRALGAGVGVRTQSKMRYTDDFYRMELWHGDTLVEPIYPYRTPNSVNFDGAFVYAEDTAFAGIYIYDSSAFSPDAPVKLRVFKESDTSRVNEYMVPAGIQKKVWDDFEPWRNTGSKQTEAGKLPVAASDGGAQ